MPTHLGLQRILLPSAQVSSLTTGSITLPSARGAFDPTLGYTEAFESINSTTLSTDTSTITFSSIPSTYRYLQLRGNIRLERSGDLAGELIIRFNNDSTANNYRSYYAGVSGTTSTSTYAATQTGSQTGYYGLRLPANNSLSNNFGAFIVDIYDYSSSAATTIRTSSGFLNNGTTTSNEEFGGAMWNDGSTVHTISLHLAFGTAIKTNSTLDLYGVKA